MGSSLYTPGETATNPLPSTLRRPKGYEDESYQLFSKVHISEPSVEEKTHIRNKCIRWILPFLCVGYHLMFVDKQTVGALYSDPFIE
jgi:hypothetical protein